MGQTETLELLREFPGGATLNQLNETTGISERKVLSRDLHALKKWKLVDRTECGGANYVVWRAFTQNELDEYRCILCGRKMLQANKMCGSCRRKNQ